MRSSSDSVCAAGRSAHYRCQRDDIHSNAWLRGATASTQPNSKARSLGLQRAQGDATKQRYRRRTLWQRYRTAAPYYQRTRVRPGTTQPDASTSTSKPFVHSWRRGALYRH